VQSPRHLASISTGNASRCMDGSFGSAV
jgi:hypothetical protein